MDIRHHSLPEPAALALLNVIIPGSTLCSIRPVNGEFYNRQFYLVARSKEDEDLHFVVKLYQGERDFCVRRARVEYQALRWLHLHQRPAPQPVFLDDSGALLGGPGLGTRFLPGSPIIDPPYPPDLGRQMALTLASIHAYPWDASVQAFLLDKNPEKLWWRRSGSIPDWMAADPDGRLIWEAVARLLPRQEKTPVANLTLWKLAAAVHPIYLPEGWIDHSPVRERFRRFVQEAVQEENLLKTDLKPKIFGSGVQ